jgi:hypothetical protein
MHDTAIILLWCVASNPNRHIEYDKAEKGKRLGCRSVGGKIAFKLDRLPWEGSIFVLFVFLFSADPQNLGLHSALGLYSKMGSHSYDSFDFIVVGSE